MQTILIIANRYPKPDTASGDLRFATLIGMLAERFQVCFCALSDDGSILPKDVYSHALEKKGITIGHGNLLEMLKTNKPEIVWCEFYHQARSDYVALARRICPKVRILVDSVDIHFNRLAAQARLSGLAKDHAHAEAIKEQELAAYARADLTVAVSKDDANVLLNAMPGAHVSVVPNVHHIPPFTNPANRTFGELVFVGGFKHAPNVDAMLYFCNEVLPLITAAQPAVKLTVIGSSPPGAVKTLASDHVEVLGYVPDTSPYLKRAYISVAPLRYGGGMKGKVGEALSYGLPVVTTSFGVEGFGLRVGRDVLVGDTPETFAGHVISLLKDAALHTQLAQDGRRFIEEHYSVAAVKPMLDSCIDQLMQTPPRRQPWASLIRDNIASLYEQHIGWRLDKH